MHQINERKRAKQTGKGAYAPHLGISHWIIDRPEFKALPLIDLRTLIHLGRQYNSRNNGDLCVQPLREHITSRDVLQRSLYRLQEEGWLLKTKRGGLGIGPDLYAITWWPIDLCKGKHDYAAETVPSHTWMKNRPDRPTVLVVPSHGTDSPPFDGPFNELVPSHGTRKAFSHAA